MYHSRSIHKHGSDRDVPNRHNIRINHGIADNKIASDFEDDAVYAKRGGVRCTLIDVETIESREHRKRKRIITNGKKGHKAASKANNKRTPSFVVGHCSDSRPCNDGLHGHHRRLLSSLDSLNDVRHPSPNLLGPTRDDHHGDCRHGTLACVARLVDLKQRVHPPPRQQPSFTSTQQKIHNTAK